MPESMPPQPLPSQPHRKHKLVTVLALGVVTVVIVVSSVVTGQMGGNRANLSVGGTPVVQLANLTSAELTTMPAFGENSEELRTMLEQIHSSYMSQMEMMRQMQDQNSSLLNLLQQAASSDYSIAPYSPSSFSSVLPPLNPASSSFRTSPPPVPSSSVPASSSFSSVSPVPSSVPSSSSFVTTSSAPVSSAESVSSSSFSSDPASVPVSSVASVDPQLAALRDAYIRSVVTLPAAQADLARRLTAELTLTPTVEPQVLSFVTRDLPVLPLTGDVSQRVFTHFKLTNGAVLKNLDVVPNADVDPKDWYAQQVVTVAKLGIMKGSGKTGLFEAERPMSQAELAKTLANAMNLAGGTLLKPAAPNAGVFQTWPQWGKDAISELRARGLDTSFFRSNPEEPVNRLQLARAISDTVFRGDQPDVTKTKFFRDTVTLPPAIQQYVAKVSSFGVMTGNPQTQLFEPYAQTNRAQVAKTIATAISVKVGAHSSSVSSK
jgi:hypothetical protein